MLNYQRVGPEKQRGGWISRNGINGLIAAGPSEKWLDTLTKDMQLVQGCCGGWGGVGGGGGLTQSDRQIQIAFSDALKNIKDPQQACISHAFHKYFPRCVLPLAAATPTPTQLRQQQQNKKIYRKKIIGRPKNWTNWMQTNQEERHRNGFFGLAIKRNTPTAIKVRPRQSPVATARCTAQSVNHVGQASVPPVLA